MLQQNKSLLDAIEAKEDGVDSSQQQGQEAKNINNMKSSKVKSSNDFLRS